MDDKRMITVGFDVQEWNGKIEVAILVTGYDRLLSNEEIMEATGWDSSNQDVKVTQRVGIDSTGRVLRHRLPDHHGANVSTAEGAKGESGSSTFVQAMAIAEDRLGMSAEMIINLAAAASEKVIYPEGNIRNGVPRSSLAGSAAAEIVHCIASSNRNVIDPNVLRAVKSLRTKNLAAKKFISVFAML